MSAMSEIVCVADPSATQRACDAFVRAETGKTGRLEVVTVAVTEGGRLRRRVRERGRGRGDRNDATKSKTRTRKRRAFRDARARLRASYISRTRASPLRLKPRRMNPRDAFRLPPLAFSETPRPAPSAGSPPKRRRRSWCCTRGGKSRTCPKRTLRAASADELRSTPCKPVGRRSSAAETGPPRWTPCFSTRTGSGQGVRGRAEGGAQSEREAVVS